MRTCPSPTEWFKLKTVELVDRFCSWIWMRKRTSDGMLAWSMPNTQLACLNIEMVFLCFSRPKNWTALGPCWEHLVAVTPTVQDFGHYFEHVQKLHVERHKSQKGSSLYTAWKGLISYLTCPKCRGLVICSYWKCMGNPLGMMSQHMTKTSSDMAAMSIVYACILYARYM